MNEKELRLIAEISKNSNLSQRLLARRTNLSLGLINIILSRLVKRGIVEIKNLNKRKVQYLLTPKGFAVKTRHTYNYVIKTINQMKQLIGEEKLKELAYAASKKEEI